MGVGLGGKTRQPLQAQFMAHAKVIHRTITDSILFWFSRVPLI